jgi:hypothetical protein
MNGEHEQALDADPRVVTRARVIDSPIRSRDSLARDAKRQGHSPSSSSSPHAVSCTASGCCNLAAVSP